MKVYVITKGAYSDYHIVAVVLDKTRAEEIVKAVSNPGWSFGFGEARIEEYDTDTFATQYAYDVYYRSKRWYADIDEYADHQSNHVYNDHSFLVFAKDKDHAIKIAQDMRAEYLATKKGIT
jgi:superfamily II DNA or RNA helicase